jgi:hypothetical protein
MQEQRKEDAVKALVEESERREKCVGESASAGKPREGPGERPRLPAERWNPRPS